MARIEPATKPFKDALAELLRENDYTTQTGNVNWHAFARELAPEIHYESLRKALAGTRTVTPHIMEECARVLRIKPEHFVEYRAYRVAEDFDVKKVGFEQVLANLETWSRETAASKPKRRSRRQPA